MIEFTEHARRKIAFLAKHGFIVTEAMIRKAIEQPERTESGHNNRRIAQITASERHVLRVVYEEEVDERRVITVYPGRRERYE